MNKISPLFHLDTNFPEALSFLTSFLSTSEIGMKGVEELRYIHDRMQVLPLTKGKIQFQSEGGELFIKNIKIKPINKIPEELLK